MDLDPPSAAVDESLALSLYMRGFIAPLIPAAALSLLALVLVVA